MINRVYESVLRRLLREEIDLGNVVFAQRRKDVESDEENTDQEERLRQEIDNYVLDNTQMSPQSISELKDLMDSKKYGGYFSSVRSGVLYRAIYNVSEEDLKKFTGGEFDGSTSGRVERSFVIHPLHGATVMSFTKTQEAADQFLIDNNTGRYDPEEYFVLFEADASKNRGMFLDFSAGIYKTKMMDVMSHEREALALGPVKVDSVSWKKTLDEDWPWA